MSGPRKLEATPQRSPIDLARGGREAAVRAMEAYGLVETAHSTHSAATTPETSRSSAEYAELGQEAGTDGAHTRRAAQEPDLGAVEPGPEPRRPCYACGSIRFWRSVNGPWVCATCHPPGSEGLVQEWLRLDGEEEEARDEGQ